MKYKAIINCEKGSLVLNRTIVELVFRKLSKWDSNASPLHGVLPLRARQGLQNEILGYRYSIKYVIKALFYFL